MLQKNFIEYTPHLDNCRIEIASSHHNVTTIGADQVLFTIDTNTKTSESYQLKNPDHFEICALAVHPVQANTFAIGMSNGLVKLLRPIHQYQVQRAEIVLKTEKTISSLSFSESGKLLGISFKEQSALIYCLQSRKIFKLPTPHEGFVNRIFIWKDQLAATIGQEGNLHLYKLSMPQKNINSEDESDDPFEQLNIQVNIEFADKFKITSQGISRKYNFINAVMGNFITDSVQQTSILISGQTSLQIIQIQAQSHNYKYERSIHQDNQILLISVLNRGGNGMIKTIVLTTENLLSIWNYSNKQKMISVKIEEQCEAIVTSIVTFSNSDMPTFAFLLNNNCSNGKIYQFTNQKLLQIQQKLNQEKIEIEDEKKQKQIRAYKQMESKAAKLIPEYPQQLLQKSYEEFQDARFLFYNNIGCVVERIQNNEAAILQLQLHDKSKPNRLKINAKNRNFDMFALREKVLVYASSNLLVFQAEKQLKEGGEGWQVRWENMRAIAIGGQWIAASNLEQIKFFDYAGNEIQSICFDRKLVAMQAYQDLLAIVYHSSLPMWDCQSFNMRIYRVGKEGLKLDRDIMLPMKTNSRLKWFGFSQEGMIYCQDTFQKLRCYLYRQNQWRTVLQLESKAQKLFIQHIQGLDVYGFRIKQTEGQREPKVLPRSLPRKIPMELPDYFISFLTHNELLCLKKVMLKNILISHEETRRNLWYKYRYGRKKQHPWFGDSKSIQSGEEIDTIKMQIDLQLFNYLKKILQSDQKRDNPQTMKSLLLIFERQSHYEQTKEKVRELLITKKRVILPSTFDDFTFKYKKSAVNCKNKVNQINFLQQILSVTNL